jgi:hypothetical protein
MKWPASIISNIKIQTNSDLLSFIIDNYCNTHKYNSIINIHTRDPLFLVKWILTPSYHGKLSSVYSMMTRK